MEKIQIILEALERSKEAMDRAIKQVDNLNKADQRGEQVVRRSNIALRAKNALLRTTGAVSAVAAKGLALFRGTLSAILTPLRGMIGQLALLVGGLSAIREVGRGLRLASVLEETEVRMSFLTGSTAAAREELSELLRLTTTTPFSLEQLDRARTNLRELAGGAIEVGEGLEIASDIAVVRGSDVAQVATELAKTFDRIRRGVNIEISERTILEAVDIQQLQAMNAAGVETGVMLDFVRARLRRFQGATAAQQATLTGLVGTFGSLLDIVRAQLFIPIRDVLTPLFVRANEALTVLISSNRVVEFGRSVAAAVSLIVQSIAEGRLTEILSLALQAGLEEGGKLGADLLTSALERIFGTQGLIVAIRFGVAVANGIINALDDVIALLVAIADQTELAFTRAFRNVVNAFVGFFEFALNKIIRGLNTALSGIIGLINKAALVIPGVSGVSGVAIGAVDFSGFELQTERQRTFAESFQASQTVTAAVLEQITGYLQEQADLSVDILTGAEGAKGADGERVSALRQLMGLLEEEKARLDGILETKKEITTENEKQTVQQQQQVGFADTLSNRFSAFVDHLGDNVRIADQLISGTLGTAINSVSAGITGLITGTATWQQVALQAGQAILSSLIQIGVEMIALQAIRTLIGTQAKTQATVEGATIATAYAPAATTAGAATFGIGTAIGVALTIAAIVAGIAALAGAFAEGGIVPGSPSSRDNRIAAVATGEGIIPAKVTSAMGPEMFEFIRSGRILEHFADGGIVPAIPSASAGVSSPSLIGGGGVGSGSGSRVNVAFMDGRQQRLDFLRRDGIKVVLSEMSRRGNEVST